MSKAERICWRCSGTWMVPLSPRLPCASHPRPVLPSVHCCSLLVGILFPLAAPKVQPPAIQSRPPSHCGSPGDLVIGEEKQKSECFLEAWPCDKVTRQGFVVGQIWLQFLLSLRSSFTSGKYSSSFSLSSEANWGKSCFIGLYKDVMKACHSAWPYCSGSNHCLFLLSSDSPGGLGIGTEDPVRSARRLTLAGTLAQNVELSGLWTLASVCLEPIGCPVTNTKNRFWLMSAKWNLLQPYPSALRMDRRLGEAENRNRGCSGV